MDRGVWQATIHEVAKNRTWMSDWACTLPFPLIAGFQSKANFPFYQPGLFIGFWARPYFQLQYQCLKLGSVRGMVCPRLSNVSLNTQWMNEWMNEWKDSDNKAQSLDQWFSDSGPGPAATTSLGNLLEAQFFNCASTQPSLQIIWCILMFENHCPDGWTLKRTRQSWKRGKMPKEEGKETKKLCEDSKPHYAKSFCTFSPFMSVLFPSRHLICWVRTDRTG